MAACLSGAGSMAAVPLTMTYYVTDLGGGNYGYNFTLEVDNNDGTYAAGQGWGWLIFGDAQSLPTPLTNWQMNAAQFPIGPWTGISSSGGYHNGPTFAYVLDHWVPSGIGSSLTWYGTSTANLHQGQLLWSTLSHQGGAVSADFVVATRIYPVFELRDSGGATIAYNDSDDVGAVSALTGDTFSYQIHNTGPINLVLNGSPLVQVSATSNANANVTSNPTSPVAPSGNTGFSVFVQPQGSGAFFVDLAISSDDPNASPFVYRIEGTGLANSSPEISIPTGSGWTNTGGGNYVLEVDPGDSYDDDLIVSDPTPDNMTMTVTPPGTQPATVTNQPASISTPTAGPFTLNWQGTAEANNPPGTYTWQLAVSDGVTTPNFTASIIIRDLPPTHAIGASATGGDGLAPATAYTTTVLAGTSAALSMADVDNPNVGQAITLGTVTPDGGNPAGVVGFGFSMVGTTVVATPAGTLQVADVGTHAFAVDIEDAGNTVTLYIAIVVTTPEIDVLNAASAAIASGGTDNAPAAFAGTPFNMTYTIENNGSATLTITTVSTSATTNCSAVVSANPAGTVAAGGATTFTVTVTPAAVGGFSFLVTINNDDLDEGTYTFTVNGTASSASNMQVERLSVAKPHNGADNLGNTPAGGTSPHTYTIDNIGTSDLTITGVTVSATVNCTVNVTAQPGATVIPAGSTTFTISVSPTTEAAFSFTLNIASNDPAKNPYVINVSGVGVPGGFQPPSSGGGGGGGGGGCITGSSSLPLLVVLAAALAGIVALRRRAA